MSDPVARRQFLYRSLTGVGGIALLDLLNRDLRPDLPSLAIRWRRGSRITHPRQSHAFF